MANKGVNELLADIISTYAPQFGRAITDALNLAMTAIECRVENTAGDTYASMRAALSECGTILEESIEDGIISGVIFSGAANMNPAFILLRAEGTGIHIAASAKEGLIKQHTAERAIDAFKSTLAAAEGA